MIKISFSLRFCAYCVLKKAHERSAEESYDVEGCLCSEGLVSDYLPKFTPPFAVTQLQS